MTMGSIKWGYDFLNASSLANRQAAVTDFDAVANPHMAICGDTGSGKTHIIRLAINELIKTASKRPRIHVLDVHGDIKIDEAICSTVMFSQSTRWGFNPLKVNPDPHFGGVRNAIQFFIETLKLSPTASRALGPKQMSVLQNLLLDVFYIAGFDPNDPRTWNEYEDPRVNNAKLPGRIYLNIPIDEKERAKAEARNCGVHLTFHGELSCWHVDRHVDGMLMWPLKQWGRKNPTLEDLCRYATRRRDMLFTGMGQREVILLEKFHRKSSQLSRQIQNAAKAANNGSSQDELAAAKDAVEQAKQEALDGYSAYLDKVESGDALQAILKYDSADSLSTVKQILDTLLESGIFWSEKPPFDSNVAVWRYVISPLRDDYKKFLVNMRCQEIFDNAVRQGECDYIRDVIVIDEGATYVSDDPEHILNKIALQARKFGLAIWFASQSPTHYPEQLMTSMGTKVILGLDPQYWPMAQRQLRIDPDYMSWIKPRYSLLLMQKLKGESVQKWQRVNTRDETSAVA